MEGWFSVLLYKDVILGLATGYFTVFMLYFNVGRNCVSVRWRRAGAALFNRPWKCGSSRSQIQRRQLNSQQPVGDIILLIQRRTALHGGDAHRKRVVMVNDVIGR